MTIPVHLYRVADRSRRFWTAFTETGVSVAGRPNGTDADAIDLLAQKLGVPTADLSIMQYTGVASAAEVARHRAEFTAKRSASAEADQAAALRERAAIVKWLRRAHEAVEHDDLSAAILADCIERGDHHEEP